MANINHCKLLYKGSIESLKEKSLIIFHKPVLYFNEFYFCHEARNKASRLKSSHKQTCIQNVKRIEFDL